MWLYFSLDLCCREERRYDESGTCEADEMTMFRSRLICDLVEIGSAFFFSLCLSPSPIVHFIDFYFLGQLFLAPKQ